MNWTPDFTNALRTITAQPAGHPIFPQRVEDWREFLCFTGSLPPVLICESGWLVNGHHRLIVAREMNVPLWGVIVEYRSGQWPRVTGNLANVI